MKIKIRFASAMLLAGLLAGGIFVGSGFAQDGQNAKGVPTSPARAQSSSNPAPPPFAAPDLARQEVAERARQWHTREGNRYQRDWGVDIVGARRISSGEMVEFRYRVLDANKAKALNDKRSTAFLIDQATGRKLIVPQMEKVGLLRTTAPPQLNRVYWMVFANPGNIVKPGSVVNVVIGNFHVDGLIAQ